MTIHLSGEAARSIEAAVQNGRFATAADAIAAAWRLLETSVQARPAKPPPTPRELNRRLLASELIARLPDPTQDIDDDDDLPIDIEGESLSEPILRERR